MRSSSSTKVYMEKKIKETLSGHNGPRRTIELITGDEKL